MQLPTSLIDSTIERGAILHSMMFDYIGHGKFFIIIGIAEDKVAGYFFINSNINKALEDKPEQLSMQYHIKHSDYNFLRYDSFICATDIKEIPIAKLVASIEEGTTQFVENLKTEHLNDILEAARKSVLFSPNNKKRYLY